MFTGDGRPRKPELRAQARGLRRALGLPYKQIAARLGVSPSSAYHWTRDITISEEQRRRNAAHMRTGTAASRRRSAAWSEHNRENRRRYQQSGRDKARQGDALHMAGCMLYWAEGAKGRWTAGFANSDAEMVRFFLTFLRESLYVPDEKVRLHFNVYSSNGLTIEEVETHWLTRLDLPRSCLRQHIVDHFPTSSSGRRPKRLPYGVCHLRVHSTELAQHIYGAIQEYAGFEEPRWLDCDPRSGGVPSRHDPR